MEPRRFDKVHSTLAYICRGKPCQKLARNAFVAGQTCHQKMPCSTLAQMLVSTAGPEGLLSSDPQGFRGREHVCNVNWQ